MGGSNLQLSAILNPAPMYRPRPQGVAVRPTKLPGAPRVKATCGSVENYVKRMRNDTCSLCLYDTADFNLIDCGIYTREELAMQKAQYMGLDLRCEKYCY